MRPTENLFPRHFAQMHAPHPTQKAYFESSHVEYFATVSASSCPEKAASSPSAATRCSTQKVEACRHSQVLTGERGVCRTGGKKGALTTQVRGCRLLVPVSSSIRILLERIAVSGAKNFPFTSSQAKSAMRQPAG